MIDAYKYPVGIYEGGENYDKADLKLWIKNFAPYVISYYTSWNQRFEANS